MYQGWRGCFASNLWWDRFPPAPQNKIKIKYEEKDSYRRQYEIQ
jgi:hypothetical protein